MLCIVKLKVLKSSEVSVEEYVQIPKSFIYDFKAQHSEFVGVQRGRGVWYLASGEGMMIFCVNGLLSASGKRK